jgi:hypothetical protein
MFSRIRRRITYTNVAMTLALVFAMSGGAYAASKYLITSTKQIKPSVLAQLKGKNGKNGAPGLAGPVGPVGPGGKDGANGTNGAQGLAGENGKNGTPGSPGSTVLNGAGAPSAGTGVNGDFYIDTTANNIYGPKTAGAWGSLTALKGAAGTPGKSVVSAEFSGAHAGCSEERGGSEFEVASSGVKTYACNGSPWTVGGTLPSGKSEKGEWATVSTVTAAKEVLYSPISFTIPLGATVTGHFIGTNEELAGETNESPAIASGECKGNPGNPEAAPGNLCIFSGNLSKAEPALGIGFMDAGKGAFGEVGAVGAVVVLYSTGAGVANGSGTWAVTEKP